jgi:hypothetical protein
LRITDDPFPETPGERDRLRTQVEDRITSMDGMAPELAAELRSYSSDFLRSEKREPRHTHFYGGQLGWTNWYIRDDDLDLVKYLTPTAVGVATYLSAAAAVPWVLVATALMSVLGVARQLRKKSTTLLYRQCQVLTALKACGPTSLDALVPMMQERVPPPDTWTDKRVLETLQSLQSVRLRDGTVASFVAHTGDGLWSVSGL